MPQAGPAASAKAGQLVPRNQMDLPWVRQAGHRAGAPGHRELGRDVGDLDPHQEPHPVQPRDEVRGPAGLDVGREGGAVVHAVEGVLDVPLR